jgi:hypothetical protein
MIEIARSTVCLLSRWSLVRVQPRLPFLKDLPPIRSGKSSPERLLGYLYFLLNSTFPEALHGYWEL